MNETKTVHIDFNKIKETAQRGVRRSFVFLGLGINAALDPEFKKYSLSDLSPIHLVPSHVPDETLEIFKSEFGKWIVSNGLRELIETFALFLDQIHFACLYIAAHKELISPDVGQTWDKGFPRKGIKDKQRLLNERFGIQAQHPEQINSIHQIRNCVTHRHGIIGIEDCDEGATAVTLRWTGFDIYVETPTGETIDLDLPLKEEIHLKDGGVLKLNFSERTKEYPIGTQIDLSPKDLVEICNSILFSTNEILQSVNDFTKSLGIENSETST